MKPSLKDTTTPQACCYTTLWNILDEDMDKSVASSFSYLLCSSFIFINGVW